MLRRLLMAGGGSGGFLRPASAFEIIASPAGGITSINERSAIYDPANGHVYLGVVTGGGSVQVHDLDISTTPSTVVSTYTAATGLEGHAAPCLVIRSDGKIVLSWSAHDDTSMRLKVSTSTHDVSAFGSTISVSGGTISGWDDFTYMNLSQLSAESNRLYQVYREFHDVGRVSVTYSTNGGSTWSNRTLPLVAETTSVGNVIYWKQADDGVGKIHLFHTDTDRSDENPSSLFHRYYDADDGLWHKSDGTTVSSDHASASTLIMDASDGPISPCGSGIEVDGTPFCSFQTFQGTSANFYVARYRSGAWQADFVANSAGLRSDGHRTIATLAVNRENPDRAVYCKKVSGVLEIFLATSSDDGATWTHTQLTTGSSKDAQSPDAVWGQPTGLEFIWTRGDPDANLSIEAYG